MTSGVSTPLQESSAEQNPASATPNPADTNAQQNQQGYSNTYFEGSNTNGTEAPGSPNGTNGTVNSTSSLNQYSPYG